MFAAFGRIISRFWYLVLVGWVVVLIATHLAAPPWNDVALDREFAFLPADAPSRRSEEVFGKAFPNEQANSNIVLVLYRAAEAPGQLDKDKQFCQDVLEPALRQIAREEGGLASDSEPTDEPLFSSPAAPPSAPGKQTLILALHTPNAPGLGQLLVSSDHKMLLMVLELRSEFLSNQNWPLITRIENLVDRLRQDRQLPPGLDVAVTGSAVVGRDHSQAELQATRAIGLLTVVLVVGLLIVIYRAPLLALIPLVTVFVSVQLALNILAILAGAGYLTLFQGIQIYITILAYGAGVDYCLFLTARYREGLCSEPVAPAEALARAVGDVGHTLTASAATVICGIGMMTFAEFGKFREAGWAIPLTLILVLCATLTLGPALFCLAGRAAFWPDQSGASDQTARRFGLRWWLGRAGGLLRGWERLEEVLLRRPGAAWLGTVLLMLPWVICGVMLRHNLSYDLIEELPADAPSVMGTRILREHMPAGVMGPVSLMVVDPHEDFRTDRGRKIIQDVTRHLAAEKQSLGLAEVRSYTSPLGVIAVGGEKPPDLSAPDRWEAMEPAARDHYLADFGGRNRTGARFDLILTDNPFSQVSVATLGRIEQALLEALPEDVRKDSQLSAIGPTVSVRDLQVVMERDRTRIQFLVSFSVLVILILLLRSLVVPLYLLLSVLFSYFATLGVTFALFWALDPEGFTGLDWKVAIFLFTILVAVGEDYNIFLMTRIDEETRRHGPLRGVTEALTRTGPIISSCGIIMAGTFCSLLIGKLSEMKQLGFALAFGVLLDTFVVRPILVPAFLLVLRRRSVPSIPKPDPLPTDQARLPAGGAIDPRQHASGGR